MQTEQGTQEETISMIKNECTYFMPEPVSTLNIVFIMKIGYYENTHWFRSVIKTLAFKNTLLKYDLHWK